MEVKRKPFVVSVEGNIGSGKSTMLQYYSELDDVQLHPEPVEKWQNLNGHNLLEKLYSDPKRWSFQFQSYIQLTRLEILKTPTDKTVKIIERSIQNNRYCFLELAKRNESLTKEELAVLHSWFDFLDETMVLDLDLIVYLRTSPQVAYDRMRSRGRSEEAGAPLEYLQLLHDAYEDWLINQSHGKIRPQVLVLDANKSLDEMANDYIRYEEVLLGKISLPPGVTYADTYNPEDDFSSGSESSDGASR